VAALIHKNKCNAAGNSEKAVHRCYYPGSKWTPSKSRNVHYYYHYI